MAAILIGITGGIGAGKSVVSRMLRGRGFTVFDCDLEAKRLMESDTSLMEALAEVAGSDIYDAEGHLCRKLLASRIFSDTALRESVNRLVHAAVRQEMMRRYTLSERIFFVEAAIMASSGLAALCSSVWLVDAPREIRFRRAMERGGISECDLQARMTAQENENRLLAEAGVPVHTVVNDGCSSLIAQIDGLLDALSVSGI